ncbi:MAG TPA: carboxypeptidase-like regulatory domain-containing protein [Myxococcota bacterium]|nr:carboxypeptidase-like regulatory domain-containing protein [Myxococcota bacterium]
MTQRWGPTAVAAALLSVALWPAAPGHAAPVDVRAPTRLRVGLERVGASYVVSGTLLDDLNEGIAGVTLALTLRPTDLSGVEPVRLDARTDASGRFEASTPAVPGARTFAVEVHFGGSTDGLLLPADLSDEVDVARKKPVLEIAGPTTVTTKGRGVPYEVHVARPLLAGLPIALALVTRGTEHAIGTGETDAEGVAVFVVPAARLDAGGPATLVARSPASDALGLEAAETRLEIRALVESRLTLSAVPEGAVEMGERVVVSGSLAAVPAGGAEPLGDEAITLLARGPNGREAPFATVQTGADGRFHAELPTDAWTRSGALELRATYVPSVAWRARAESPVLGLRLVPPEPLPVLLYVLPLAVALGAVGVTLIRGRRRRARERSAAASPPADVEVRTGLETGTGAPAGAGGGAGGGAGTAAPATLWRVAGVVLDAVTRQGVGGAVVERAAETDAAPLATAGPGGAFETPALPEGACTLRVRAPGYVSETFTARLPHKGELGAVRISLAPVRQRVLEAFRRAALAHLPRRSLLFVWTARELGRHVRRHRPLADKPVDELGRLFDETYFSADVPDESAATRAVVLAEQAKAAVPPPAPAAGADTVVPPRDGAV